MNMDTKNEKVTSVPLAETEEVEVDLDSSNGVQVEPIYSVVAARTRRYRRRRHMTQRQVAEKAGVSYSVIVRLENVQGRVRLDIMEKVAKVLKVDLKELVG